MPVVPSELGVGALERRVTAGLGLLDTAVGHLISYRLPLIVQSRATLLRFRAGKRIASCDGSRRI